MIFLCVGWRKYGGPHAGALVSSSASLILPCYISRYHRPHSAFALVMVSEPSAVPRLHDNRGSSLPTILYIFLYRSGARQTILPSLASNIIRLLQAGVSRPDGQTDAMWLNGLTVL